MPSKVEAETGVPLPYDALLSWVGERYGPEAEAEARAVYRRAMVRYGRASTVRAARLWLKRTEGRRGPSDAPKEARMRALLSDPQRYIEGGERTAARLRAARLGGGCRRCACGGWVKSSRRR